MSDQNSTPEQNENESAVTERRSFLKRAAGMGFVAPVVATFTMSGMMAGPAYAAQPASQPCPPHIPSASSRETGPSPVAVTRPDRVCPGCSA